MTYFVCEASSVKKLESEVNQLIAKGWRPLGGVCAVNSQQTSNWWYYQAMLLVAGGKSGRDDELA